MQKEKSKYFVGQLTICIILLIGSLTTYGQDTISVKNTKNSIQLDCAMLVYVGMYSINYERTILQSGHFKMLVNAGVGGWYLTTISQWYSGLSVPFSLNYLIGSGNNYFETDMGVRFTKFSERSDKDKSPFFPIFNLGYRYQRPNGKGLIFRSFFGLSGIGIGLGKAF
jgi:hypothetical protein